MRSMYEFRITSVTRGHDDDKDPSRRNGTYITGCSVKNAIAQFYDTTACVYLGDYIDVQLWKRWDGNGRQTLTPGKGCRVLRYIVSMGDTFYARQYEHP